jgi:hypothetical protein
MHRESKLRFHPSSIPIIEVSGIPNIQIPGIEHVKVPNGIPRVRIPGVAEIRARTQMTTERTQQISDSINQSFALIFEGNLQQEDPISVVSGSYDESISIAMPQSDENTHQSLPHHPLGTQRWMLQLPEEYRAHLLDFQAEWHSHGDSHLVVKLRTLVFLAGMIWADISFWWKQHFQSLHKPRL